MALRGFFLTYFFIHNLIENLPAIGRVAVVGHDFELRGTHEVMRCRALYPQLAAPFPKRLEYFMHQIFGQFGIARALVANRKYLSQCEW